MRTSSVTPRRLLLREDHRKSGLRFRHLGRHACRDRRARFIAARSYSSTKRKAEHRVGSMVGRRRRSAKMVASVRIVAVDFDLLPRDRYVFAVLPPHRPPLAIVKLHLRRIAIRLVAARLVGLIRHEPGRIEFFMQRHVLRRMMPMLLGGELCGREQADRRGRESRAAENFQTAPDIPHVQPPWLRSERSDNTRGTDALIWLEQKTCQRLGKPVAKLP